MYNNPCEQEDNYRLLLIGNLPQLQILDRHQITKEERMAAKKLLRNLVTLDSCHGSPINVSSVPESRDKHASKPLTKIEIDEKNYTNRLIHQSFVQKLNKKLSSKRIFLEAKCEEFDKRRLNFVSEDSFWSLLYDFDIYDDLTARERDLIRQKYL